MNFQELKPQLETTYSLLAATSAIPNTKSSFKERYGAFDSNQQVDTFLSIIQQFTQVRKELGSPEILKQELRDNPDCLLQPTQPATSLYGQFVWFANQVSNVAHSYTFAYEAIGKRASQPSKLEDEVPITQMINGPGQLSQDAHKLETATTSLLSSLDQVKSKILSVSIKFSESSLINDANEVIGALTAENQISGKSIQDLKDSMNPFGKQKRKEEIAELESKISSNLSEISKKQAFTSDLNIPMFYPVNEAAPSIESAKRILLGLERSFRDTKLQLESIVSATSKQQKQNYQWLVGALEIPASLNTWKELGSSASTFSKQAFI